MANTPERATPDEFVRAKQVAAILTDNGLAVAAPDEGSLDAVERERWKCCVEVVRCLDNSPPDTPNLSGEWIVGVDQAPVGEELLMAARPASHLNWKFGAGTVMEIRGTHVVTDWGWSFPPTHFQRIKPPRCSELDIMGQCYRLLHQQPWATRRRIVDWLYEQIGKDRAKETGLL